MELKNNNILKNAIYSAKTGIIAASLLLGNFMVFPVEAAQPVNVSPSKQSDQASGEFCADAALAQHPCPTLPADVSEFDANFIYRFVGPESQAPFDRFSWQSFIAMTWPMTSAGQPVSYQAALHPDPGLVPRWQRLVRRDDVIHGEFADTATQTARAACASGDMAGFDQLTGGVSSRQLQGKVTQAGIDGGALAAQPDGVGDDDGYVLLEGFHQATGDVLIDQAGNYVLYETRMNEAAARYIRANGLGSFDGRARYADAGADISFPQRTDHVSDEPALKGFTKSSPASAAQATAQPGPGATLIKLAWRVLPQEDALKDSGVNGAFLTRKARIFVSAQNSVSGKARCREETVGLIGMHLVQRVVSGNGDRWIWSTFEHVANAPLAGNARRPNSFIAKNLFPDGCYLPGVKKGKPGFKRPEPASAPLDDIAKPKRFNLFGMAASPFASEQSATGQMAALPASAVNRGITIKALWDDKPPYAVDALGEALPPSQLVRCWQVFEGTQETNAKWHAQLQGAVWANYFLVGTQWIGNIGGAPFGVGEVPRFLSNLTMESFIQDQAVGSCLGCHSTARSDAGQPSNFTFLLAPTN